MLITFASIEYLLITLNQILTAWIAVAAFSLLLYTSQFNLRDRVARTFALILICIAIIYSGEAISSAIQDTGTVEVLLRVEWIGIILLPATYLHFSDALLATTGRPSRWKRFWAIRFAYMICGLFLLTLPFPNLFGQVSFDQPSAPQLQPTLVTYAFSLFYLALMGMSWFNFIRAYRRTTTSTSRRRMAYLITGALAPAFGSFPFLLFGSGLAQRFAIVFWLVAVVSNFLVGGLSILMAYAVAFFGVSWPDRVVKSRLLEWLLRGPITANMALGVTTIIRRFGNAFGNPYSAYVPIMMVITILLMQYGITLLFPLLERWLFFGKDRTDLDQLQTFTERFLTRNDLNQFLELVLAAICDRLQSPGGFIAILKNEKIELMVSLGKNRYKQEDVNSDLNELLSARDDGLHLFQWGDDLVIPLEDEESETESLLGLIVLSAVGDHEFDEEQTQSMHLMAERAMLAMRDRVRQEQVFETFLTLQPDVDLIQQIRAAGQYDETQLFEAIPELPRGDVSKWVKDALTHYWGGPRLTQSPLMQLKIVKDALDDHEGSSTNALRSILREAIERIRPEGERRFTAEWILYNILEMKFVEGRKVRDIALRLSMSEADLYRKQRIAIETIAREITEMEIQARVQVV